MKSETALAEEALSSDPYSEDETGETPAEESAEAFVEIHFGELPRSYFIVNAIRKEFGKVVFEPGEKILVHTGTSCEKDKNGKPFMVISKKSFIEYISEDDVVIDSSFLSKDERKLSDDLTTLSKKDLEELPASIQINIVTDKKGRKQYVVDLSALSRKEKLALSAIQQRRKLIGMLQISYK